MTPHVSTHGGNPEGVWLVLGVALLLWIFYCYCLGRICEKCGREPGLLIWIPILNTIRLLQAAGWSGWLIFLFLVPVVNVVLGIFMWVALCRGCGKSGWLVVLMFIPILNLFFIPYLAFAD